jgi:hypothetical protein
MIINFLEDLRTMSANGAHELARDLDFQDDASYSNLSNKTAWTTGSGWTMAVNGNDFTGNFNGNGFTIKNLRINRGTATEYGLFKGLDGGQVRNLTLENPYVRGYESGCLASYLFSGAVVDNVHVINGDISGNMSGGLVGYMDDTAIIRNSDFDGICADPTNGNVGGICAEADDTFTIQRCKTSGSITGATFSKGAGGILGYVYNSARNAIIEDCYSEMTVPNTANAAIIVGNNAVAAANLAIRRCWTPKNAGNYTMIRQGSATTSNNFYDSETTGLASSTGATARTTAQMKLLATFAAWNIAAKARFDPERPTNWFVAEGTDYPRLWWEWIAPIAPPQNKRRRNSAVLMLMMS